jgi:aspartate oxidase
MKEESEADSPGFSLTNVFSRPPENASDRIRDITWRHAGIVRNGRDLKTGLKLLSEITQDSNLLTVARMIHECALAREESRGAHFREDFPSRYPDKLHSYIKRGQQVRLA